MNMQNSYPSPHDSSARPYDPPSPHTHTDSYTEYNMSTPGPSTLLGSGWQGGSRRESHGSDAELLDAEFSPSSAPATPSVKGTTHPPEFIHTHHPRRGSMTPLGLNVISPRAPIGFPSGGITPTQIFSPSFGMQKSVGFNPSSQPSEHSPTMSQSARRSSAASTASTLTQSRPNHASSSTQTVNRDRRRSSITPFNPTLAPPSPSRQVVTGRNSRPSTSDGLVAPVLHTRTRTEPPSQTIGAIARSDFKETAGEFGRRGSMPHLASGGIGPSTRIWNPSLPTSRGSVGDEETTIAEGYKFGSGPSTAGPSSPAAAALRLIGTSPGGSRRSSAMSFPEGRRRSDVFAEAEAEEAEKQRRAFLAATYGVDGKRARERLSIGGPPITTPHGSPGSSARRPSLMLWEKLGMQAAHRAAGPLDVGSASAPTLPIFGEGTSFEDSEFGQRRGSLPIAIPGGVVGRSLSKREQKEARIHDMDAPIIIHSDADVEAEESSEEEDEADALLDLGIDGTAWGLTAPVRPLPPLLPLSDPGPRLLPSTLALHRASHLLSARNLQPEPLPHPLPRSLHPPAPVDLAEFDIDFILAGSLAQLGGDKKNKNAQVDTLSPPPPALDPPTPTLRLGPGGEDDSFAKFVGQFDDEYGDRRGEWTFRSSTTSTSNEELRDPLEKSASREAVKAEWESLGAGKYELYGNGEVRSLKSGSIWRVQKIGGRDYELEEVRKGNPVRSPTLGEPSTIARPAISTSPPIYCLASKAVHCECGGVKTASSSSLAPPPRIRQSSSRANSGSMPPPRSAQIRESMSEAGSPRRDRLQSEDSGTTTRAPVSSSMPLSSAINSLLPKKKRQYSNSKEVPNEPEESRGRPSVSFLGKLDPSKKERSPSRDRGEKEKDKKKGSGGFGQALKRGLASIKHANQGADDKRALREEKEREKMQSQSWSGALLSHRDGPSFIHPSGRTNSTSHGLSAHPFLSHPASTKRKSSISLQTASVTPSQHSSMDMEDKDRLGFATPRSDDQDKCSEVLVDEEIGSKREGKGWVGVPDDAVAMVIPIESDGQNGPAGMVDTSNVQRPTSPLPDHQRQALLVWFVPFNSEEDRPPLTTIASTASSSRETTSSINQENPNPSSSSLPKFQKLLRRRASKEKDILKPTTSSPGGPSQSKPQPHVSFSSDIGGRCHPLPFRSFRIVSRAVDWDDLRSESSSSSIPSTSPPVMGFTQWSERNPRPPIRSNTGNSTSISNVSTPSPGLANDNFIGSGTEESHSTAPTSTIGTGRNFPTVIAVCHSRTQGVEFVLEGLDRLGFCQGESAWGPTGYEEWRGTGLSDKGRELLDLLWAGCVAVLGIAV